MGGNEHYEALRRDVRDLAAALTRILAERPPTPADAHALQEQADETREAFTWMPQDERSRQLRSWFRVYVLVGCCIGQVFTAGVLALDGLYWMALGQLITVSALLTYAYEARERKP
jgi:hypothetical protein